METEKPHQPNLFHYATSELSQDAFICWLSAWADPKFEKADPSLHRTARQFLISLIRKTENPFDENSIRTVNVTPQADRIDVLIEINKDSADKLAILIEDKTHTDHHHEQLDRYFKIVNLKHSYSPDQIIPIYFKTGYQSKFDVGRYKTYLRKDFLQFLRGESTANNIYRDFLDHLERMEYVVNQYEKTNLFDESGKSLWSDNDWRGFFLRVYDNRDQLYAITQDDGANWNYIANPAGGFFGFWWYFIELPDQAYKPYLQLENQELCFKIEVIDQLKRQEYRHDAYNRLVKASEQLGLEIKRPARMGNGRYMTVSRWKGNYREVKEGKLDFDATLENLKKAQHILDTAFLK